MNSFKSVDTVCGHYNTAVATTRPCRTPHHTISAVGLIGGGQVPTPGEVALAHHGVLFLDARPEFQRQVLELLPRPLGKGILYLQSRERYQSSCFRGLGDSGGGSVLPIAPL
jgi:magnesium chelatase family protein